MMYQKNYELRPEEVLEYLRKSQSDDPDLSVGEVLAKHEAILDEWAEKNLGGKVPEVNRFREVVSGETIKERVEIQKILRLIESPQYRAVLIVEPQRITRGDLEEIGRIMKLLKYTNTLVLTTTRIYDLRDEYDWDAFERELKRGNDYLEYTKKILNRGRLLSVSQGNFLGNVPPYGYDKDVVMDGKRRCPTLKINEEQANVVRMIFDMYVNKGMGPSLICRHLDELAIDPPKGKTWSPPAVRDMLQNVHYVGKVRWNWRKTLTIVEDGEYKKTRPKNKIGEYLIYEGRHPAIISEEVFNASLARFGKNPRVNRNGKLKNALSGLIFCTCGRAMVLKPMKKSAPRLICTDQVHCGTGSCVYDDIVEKVADVLAQCVEDFEIRIQNDTNDSAQLHAELIKSLEKKLEKLKARELSQWKAQADPDERLRMPPEIFAELNAELLKEREEINDALCKAYASQPEQIDYKERLLMFRDALEALKDPAADPAKKNELLKLCISRITYKREKPQRIKNVQEWQESGETAAAKAYLSSGAGWTDPPVELDVKLRV